MKKHFIVLIFCVIANLSSFAQEGMWMLNQLGQLDLAKKGLKIPLQEIYEPGKPCLASAVIMLDGGTASFVSPEGLVVTNHHVAYAALQRTSTVNSDFLANGFLAKERSAEINAPGYQARLMTEMKDVTKDVLTVAAGITDPVEKE